MPGDVNETTKPQKPWGEVRIVSPGHDVKLTKIDVLPLQIEMAASGHLQNPAWITSINGGAEERHELPPPTEPQYAVYQPMIYLDELKVAEWDVISYYAKVETPAPAEYTSQIFFIEVRPFREDILKATGGGKGGGHSADLLEKLNELVKRQTTDVQETHRYQQTEYPSDDMRKQDKKKLVDAESGLSVASNHLYGEIVADNENAPIGEILDHLAGAQQQMDKAVDNLGEDVIPLAKQNEQSALAELVATRKAFYKVISDHPGAFGDSNGGGAQSGTAADGKNKSAASASDSLKSLSQVTEMRNRDQAALNQLKAMAQRQQLLADTATANNAAGNSAGNGGAMAKSETDLKNDVEKLMQDNPDLFRDVDPEKASLQSDMQQAIDNLSAGDNETGSHYLTHATADMGDLQKAVQRNHDLQQTAEAYKLKKIIDQNIQQLGQEKNKGGSLSPQEMKDLVNSATRSTGTLKDIADQPGGGGFGPGLQQSLSADNQAALDQALQKLGQTTPGAESQGAAGDAQGKLSQVSQAFEKSQPDLGKMNSNPGQNGGQGSGSATGDRAGRGDAGVAGADFGAAGEAAALHGSAEQGTGRNFGQPRGHAVEGQVAGGRVASGAGRGHEEEGEKGPAIPAGPIEEAARSNPTGQRRGQRPGQEQGGQIPDHRDRFLEISRKLSRPHPRVLRAAFQSFPMNRLVRDWLSRPRSKKWRAEFGWPGLLVARVAQRSGATGSEAPSWTRRFLRASRVRATSSPDHRIALSVIG